MFCPMTEVVTTKQFITFINQAFPGGALFILLSDADLKRLLMQLSSDLLYEQGRVRLAARVVGVNKYEGKSYWVFSEGMQLSECGREMQPGESPFMWLKRLVKGNNILIDETLACTISTPLDDGMNIVQLLQSILRFMPENFMPAMATIAACIMGANYVNILQAFGCCGVPMLTGVPGSCKSEAAKCGLSLFGAHNTHLFNNQSTPSYLFKVVSKTTIPVVVDDISEKAADTWEELFVDAYNGTGRGTRTY